jgi:hypothetical protein
MLAQYTGWEGSGGKACPAAHGVCSLSWKCAYPWCHTVWDATRKHLACGSPDFLSSLRVSQGLQVLAVIGQELSTAREAPWEAGWAG